MTAQTPTQTPLDAFDAWCHSYEAAVYDAEAREAWAEEERARQFTAEVSPPPPSLMERAQGPLLFLLTALVSAGVIVGVLHLYGRA